MLVSILHALYAGLELLRKIPEHLLHSQELVAL